MSVEPTLIYGVLAEFASSESLVNAARELTTKGYTKVEAYSPFPVEGLAEALNFRRTWLPFVVLVGAVIGGGLAYAGQYWICAIDYPLNIGGRPLHSWPSFIPVTFEMTILGGAFGAVFGMLALNGLPRPHHPLFAIPEFAGASRDKYFLAVQSIDPLFHLETTEQLLQELQAQEVIHVPSLP